MFKKGIKIHTIKIHKPSLIAGVLSILFFFFFNFDFNFKVKNNSNSNSINIKEVFAQNSDSVYEKVFVSRIIDGDTIELKDKRVIRIIGINAPEDTKIKEAFGDYATEYAKEILEKKYVYLQKDSSDLDKYNRLLRTIWLTKPSEQDDIKNIQFLKDNNFAAKLLEKGYAKPMSIEPNINLKELYTTIAIESQENKKGIWGITKQTRGDF